MTFEEEDKFMKGMMERIALKEPPQALLVNFEAEVFDQLAPPPAFPLSTMAVLGIGIILIAGAVHFFKVPKFESVPQAKVTSISEAVVQPIPAAGQEKEIPKEIETPALSIAEKKAAANTMESIASDLMILDMLGENDVLDSPERIEMDLDLLNQMTASAEVGGRQ